MRVRSFLVFAFAALITVVGCGESSNGGTAGSGGTAGAGGSAGTGGAAGVGGNGGAADDDCNRICESPCVEEYLPVGAVDDCVRSCRMGFFECIPEIIAALECIELVSCDTLADTCIPESAALTACLSM
jgi:hypothetical protein